MNTLVLPGSSTDYGQDAHREPMNPLSDGKMHYSDESMQGFLTRYVAGLYHQIEKISNKIQSYPELINRWQDNLTTIEGNLGAILYSFENLIHDPGFDWKLGRKEFDSIIASLGKIENFVDKYIALKASKKVEKIINDTVPIIKEQEDLLSLPHKKKEESIKEVSLEKKRKRREKIVNFVFKETPGRLLIDPEIINKRISSLEAFYELFGVGTKELEDIILENKDKYDKKWLNDNLKILIQEPTNTKLRQDVECALYYLRKGGTLPDFTGMHERADQRIDIFTLGGTMTLLPPFRQYKGLLYGRILLNGKLELCKFDTQTMRLNKVTHIEILDKASSTWKAKSFIPLVIDRVFIERISAPVESITQETIKESTPMHPEAKSQENITQEWQDTQPNPQVIATIEDKETLPLITTENPSNSSEKEEKKKPNWISHISTRAKSLWSSVSKKILG